MPNRKNYTWHCGAYKLKLGENTSIMGVLNVTPDSFSDGGRFFSQKKAVDHALKMADEGADIIDIGGESTRPGSLAVSAEEEISRVAPIIKKLSKKMRIPLSIDTTKSDVARIALDNGAAIVNDISGLRFDRKMAQLISEYKAGCVIMHIKGTPRTMQRTPRYNNLLTEITAWLKKSSTIALQAGVKKRQIAIDPGIGFGKTLKHNLEILNKLDSFKRLGFPVLVGLSRKSFIGKLLDLPVNKRLVGTAAACACAIRNGAHIIRVHDVKEMKQVAKIADTLSGA